jgi:hypothetical protein
VCGQPVRLRSPSQTTQKKIKWTCMRDMVSQPMLMTSDCIDCRSTVVQRSAQYCVAHARVCCIVAVCHARCGVCCVAAAKSMQLDPRWDGADASAVVVMWRVSSAAPQCHLPQTPLVAASSQKLQVSKGLRSINNLCSFWFVLRHSVRCGLRVCRTS